MKKHQSTRLGARGLQRTVVGKSADKNRDRTGNDRGSHELVELHHGSCEWGGRFGPVSSNSSSCRPAFRTFRLTAL
jgi:hypothetical protein